MKHLTQICTFVFMCLGFANFGNAQVKKPATTTTKPTKAGPLKMEDYANYVLVPFQHGTEKNNIPEALYYPQHKILDIRTGNIIAGT